MIPFEKYIYKDRGVWQVYSPVGQASARALLLSRGVAGEDVDTLFKRNNYLKIMSVENMPNQPALFKDAQTQLLRLNTWVEPRLKPVPGEWPRISKLISWLLGHDPEGVEWFLNWLAFKVQNPDVLLLISTVLCGSHGTGKNTLARVIFEMLGPDNCANIDRKALESRFNARWASSLFVFADEVVTSDNARDLTELLKIYIASEKIELEGKGTNQREIRNRLGWLFATNGVTPLNLEEGDRRYTVFRNFDPITDEHRAMIQSCYDITEPLGLDPAFVHEIQAFWHDLNGMSVDRRLIAKPYENQARRDLIEANKPAHDAFFKEVDENSIDFFLKEMAGAGEPGLAEKSKWDFGEEGVSTGVLYRAYRRYCENTGRHALALAKFGGAIQKHRPVWEGPIQKRVPGTRDRIYIYRVKRSSDALAEWKARGQERDKQEQALEKREAKAA